MQFLVCTQPSKLFSQNFFLFTVETTGEIFEKIKLALEYNGSAPPTKGDATTIQKRLPNFSNALSKNHRQNGILPTNLWIMLRKHWISRCKLTVYQLKFERDLKTICMVLMLVFFPNNGYTCELLCEIRYWPWCFVCTLNFCRKNEILKKKLFQQIMLVVLEHHMKRITYHINITHLYNFFHQKDSEQYKHKISLTIQGLVLNRLVS